MSPKTLWPFFHHGELQNSVHHKAYCKDCVAYHLMWANLVEQLEDLDPATAILAKNAQFATGELFLGIYAILCIFFLCPACSSTGSIGGKKSVFIAHLLGHEPVHCVLMHLLM